MEKAHVRIQTESDSPKYCGGRQLFCGKTSQLDAQDIKNSAALKGHTQAIKIT